MVDYKTQVIHSTTMPTLTKLYGTRKRNAGNLNGII